MAVIDIGEVVLRGRQGPITFVYRKGTNFTRITVTPRNPRSPAQQAHRALFGQLQGLGSIWNRDFIVPYFQGDLATQIPYTRFIKYNWQHWGKTLPAWREALPFWDLPRSVPFGSVPFPGDEWDRIPLKILAHIGDPAVFPNAELYGFYTDAQPEDYYKLTPQPISQAVWQTFDTGLNAAALPPVISAVVWLQIPATTTPLCMPANFPVSAVPACLDWPSFTCSLATSHTATTLTVSMRSDLSVADLGSRFNGYVRFWDEAGTVLATVQAIPAPDPTDRVAYVNFDTSTLPSPALTMQGWFQDIQTAIPVSVIARAQYAL